jgi:hypothetical protein
MIMPRRLSFNKRLPALFGMLVVVSIFFSFQGTQWSASDGAGFVGKNNNNNNLESGIAPVHQEAALRTIAVLLGNNSTTMQVSKKESKTAIPPNNTTKVDATTHQAADVSSSQARSSTVTDTIPSKSKSTFNTTTTATATATATATTNRTFAACLLIKDDNDILNEWIAYHYHVLNLRFIIVATDPFSQTSPSEVLEQWRQPPFYMSIVEWKDQDYMPEYFLQGKYDQVPSFLPAHLHKNPKSSVWHKHQLKTNPDDETVVKNISVKEIKEDLVHINNHRFRQATFVSHCFRLFQQQQRHTWVIHIDTDEYMVINPRLRARPRAVKGVPLPTIPHAGSVVQFLQDMYEFYPKRLLPSCLMMPTILFGATENYNATLLAKLPSPHLWNRTRFESLRWTYHADLKEGIANGLQKAIVDVSTLPDDHPIFVTQLIKSVHQPLDSNYDKWKDPNTTTTTTTTGHLLQQGQRPRWRRRWMDSRMVGEFCGNPWCGNESTRLGRLLQQQQQQQQIEIQLTTNTQHLSKRMECLVYS